jgi:hypothetical protein
MKLFTITSLFVAACTTSSPGTVIDHRVTATACTASAGDTNGPDQCLSDADCAAGGVCSCAGSTFEYAHETRNLCVAASCRIDGDCGAEMCSPSLGDSGPFYGVQTYACHTPDDTCGNDNDCAVQNGVQGYCAFAPPVGHWQCGYNFAAG